jgi:hypothetical protein
MNKCFNHTKGYQGEGPTALSPVGLLKITTANITGAGSISKLDLSLSDIWCIQEHRLLKKASITKFSKKHNNSGWSSFLGPAHRTEKSTSGGVGFLWKPCLDVASEPEALVTGRLAVMTIRTKDLGMIVIYSVYGHSGEGAGESNKKLIDYAIGHAMASRIPYLIGGDWNIEAGPFETMLHRFGNQVALLAPASPACFTTGCASTLDMFVAHPRLTMVLSGMAMVDRTHQIATHLPVSIAIRTQVRDDRVLVLKTPEQKCDGTSVVGPHKEAAAGWTSWEAFKQAVAPGLWTATHTADSSTTIKADTILQVLMDRWTDTVQKELADHFALTAVPNPCFQTKHKKVTTLVKQGTGALTRSSDHYEWLWRRLMELRATTSAGKNPAEGLKALNKGLKEKASLHPWHPAGEWLGLAHKGPGLGTALGCLDQLVELAKTPQGLCDNYRESSSQRGVAHPRRKSMRKRGRVCTHMDQASRGASYAYRYLRGPHFL